MLSRAESLKSFLQKGEEKCLRKASGSGAAKSKKNKYVYNWYEVESRRVMLLSF